jgi:hypothetical protein
VRGLVSLGTFSRWMVNRPNSPPTSISCTLRVPPGTQARYRLQSADAAWLIAETTFFCSGRHAAGLDEQRSKGFFGRGGRGTARSVHLGLTATTMVLNSYGRLSWLVAHALVVEDTGGEMRGAARRMPLITGNWRIRRSIGHSFQSPPA